MHTLCWRQLASSSHASSMHYNPCLLSSQPARRTILVGPQILWKIPPNRPDPSYLAQMFRLSGNPHTPTISGTEMTSYTHVRHVTSGLGRPYIPHSVPCPDQTLAPLFAPLHSPTLLVMSPALQYGWLQHQISVKKPTTTRMRLRWRFLALRRTTRSPPSPTRCQYAFFSLIHLGPLHFIVSRHLIEKAIC